MPTYQVKLGISLSDCIADIVLESKGGKEKTLASNETLFGESGYYY